MVMMTLEANLSFSVTLALLGLTAVGYAAATAGMKLATGGLSVLPLALVSGGLLLAVLAEIMLLRGTELAVVYLAIVAFETFLVLAFAVFFLGDVLTMKQLLGAGLVLSGLALVSH